MFIEVNNKDKRYYKSESFFKTFEYARVKVMVGRLNNNDELVRYEACGSTIRRNTTVEHTFEPGEYLITV